MKYLEEEWRVAMRLAVFTKNYTNPAYAAARLGAERVAARLGAAVEHFVPDIPDDVNQQIALIDRAIAGRPDAVVLVPVHETAVNDAIGRLDAARIPISTFVTPVTAGRPVTFVGSDDVALGEVIARHLFARLSGRGRVVIVEGTPASATSRHRMQGFRTALAAHPAIEVVATIPGDYQRDVARAAFAGLGADSRAADGILCANDVMALGVLDVLEAAGAQSLPLIVGVNAIPEAVAAIIDGRMLVTVDFDAMGMCAIATEAAIRHLRGEAVPARIMLPVTIVERDRAQAWALPYAERRLPAWADAVRHG